MGKKKQPKKTSPKRVRPRPRRFGAKRGGMWGRSPPEIGGLGGLGPSARSRRRLGGETGILGPTHGPGAKHQRGSRLAGASRSQNTSAERNSGRRTGSARGGWGPSRAPGAQRGPRRGSGVGRAIRAQNGVRNGDFGAPGAELAQKLGGLGLITRPPRGSGRKRGIWGSARSRGAPSVLTPLAHLLLPLIWGGNF